MPVEIWELYDAQEKKTGKTMVRGEEVPPGMYHIVVHIWPLNSRGEFLIQRRALTLQWKPGIWAGTGGSAVSGEDPLSAARTGIRRRARRDAPGCAASQAELILLRLFPADGSRRGCVRPAEGGGQRRALVLCKAHGKYARGEYAL